MMFENLQAYYEYLEKDNSLLLDYNTSNLLIQLRDKTDDKELKSHCSYEMFFTDYTMNSGEIRPKISYPNGESYPNFSLFDDDLDYIKKRAESVKNPKYKAKYNHLLWESKHKHNDYAKQAIENYFSFLQNASFPIDDNLSHHSFENYFKNLFTLSQTINYKRDEAIQFFVSLLGSNKINGYKEYSLMKFIAEEGKKIEPNTQQTFFDYSKKIIDNSTYPDFTGEYLQLLVILCQKLNVSPKPYHNKLAEFHIAQSAKHKESFVIHDFYLKALAQYQKAVNKEKIEEVTVLIEKAKRNINFKSVKVEHTWARMVSQLIVKSQIGNAWGGKTLWILQDSLTDYITKSTDLNLAKLISEISKEVNLVSIKYGNDTDENGCLKLKEHHLYAGMIPKITSDTDFNKLLQAGSIPDMNEISCKLILKPLRNKLKA